MRDQDNLRALQLSQDVPELGKLLLAESVCGLIENQEVCPQQCGNSNTNREHHKREGHLLALTSRTCDSSIAPLVPSPAAELTDRILRHPESLSGLPLREGLR